IVGGVIAGFGARRAAGCNLAAFFTGIPQFSLHAWFFAIATAIGCSASFFTPLAHPVNILMIAPGNYTFGDFFRSGWLLTILSFVMMLIGLILFWKL
ncbi:MAG: YeeE/YedE family protein, partial [Anaerolineales bacterium]|nr:YeeE/YedE family protein [Anaerolineales bacterium]